ncbi:hypothetical protein [Xenorhabdus sp. TS4]|uniref:hypothetical protein n=1 Tax=Xenorhabdus sp. TS4 TaxID=1873483 RepID=UPI001656C470|nr:hypothetical protein [Xenorhabdus sp. TS4]MBC8948373.1 hypothetical protein [Xenorhabdus sp. TS4]
MPGQNNKMEIVILHNADLVTGQYVGFVVTSTLDELIFPLKKIIMKNYGNNIQFNEDTILFVYGNNGLTQYSYIYFLIIKNEK